MFNDGRAWLESGSSCKNSQKVSCITGVGGSDVMLAAAEVVRCEGKITIVPRDIDLLRRGCGRSTPEQSVSCM